MTSLSAHEVETARHVFQRIDLNHNNSLDFLELRLAFENLGQPLSDQELFQLISRVDRDFNQVLDFEEFLRVIELQKKMSHGQSADPNILGAFVALGGHLDKSGSIDVAKLKRIVIEEFQLTFDIEDLLQQVDSDKSGKIDFDKFCRMIALQPRQPVAQHNDDIFP